MYTHTISLVSTAPSASLLRNPDPARGWMGRGPSSLQDDDTKGEELVEQLLTHAIGVLVTGHLPRCPHGHPLQEADSPCSILSKKRMLGGRRSWLWGVWAETGRRTPPGSRPQREATLGRLWGREGPLAHGPAGSGVCTAKGELCGRQRAAQAEQKAAWPL